MKTDATTTPRHLQQQQQTTTVSKRQQKLQNRKKAKRNVKPVRTIFLSDNNHTTHIIFQEAEVTHQLLILQQILHLLEGTLRPVELHQHQKQRRAEELINH